MSCRELNSSRGRSFGPARQRTTPTCRSPLRYSVVRLRGPGVGTFIVGYHPRSMLTNILTIDLEEWFHLDERVIPPGEWDRLPTRAPDNVRAMLDLLDACRVRGTFFALGWVAARHQELIQQIAERGHEVAVHGYLHESVAAMSADEFRRDLTTARQTVEACTGE